MSTRIITNTDLTPEEDLRQLLRTMLNRDAGGDASRMLEVVATMIEMKIWKRYGKTFQQFITTSYDEGGLGWSVNNLETVLRFKHRFEDNDPKTAERLEAMRETVRAELDKAANPAQKPGRPGNNNKVDVSTLEKPLNQLNSNSRERIIRSLKRDHPDLALKVIDREISAAEGKRQARERRGVVDASVTIRLDDPTSAAATIVKNMPREQIDELISLLLKAIHEL